MAGNKYYLTPAQLEEGGYLKIKENRVTYVASGIKTCKGFPGEKR